MKAVLAAVWKLRSTIAILLIAALAIWIGIDSWSLGAENRILLSERSDALAGRKAAKAETARVTAAAKADIAFREQAIVGLRSELARKDALIEDQTITEAALAERLRVAKTDAERVPALKDMVASLTSKFTLAESKCRDYEGIVFSLNAHLVDKDKIIAAQTAEIAASDLVIQKDDKAIRSLKADLRKARLFSNVKSVALLAVIAAVVYQAVAK